MSTDTSRKTQRQRKTARLQLKLSAELKEKIRLAASLEGMSMSAFVLSHAYEAAQHAIAHETRIKLAEEASHQVTEALTRPARALPELVELFATDRAEKLAAIVRRKEIDQAEVQRVLAIMDAARAAGWRPAVAEPESAETVKKQYDRVPDIGQPFPAWAEELIDEIDEIGVAPEQRDFARDLLKRVMVTVGIEEKPVRAFLYKPNAILKRSPVRVIRERGWVALDALLRTMFVGSMP